MDDIQVPILPRGEDNAEERQEKIGDETPPFSPPDDIKDTISDTNQAFDSQDEDSQEVYDSGKSVQDPGDRGIKGFNPPNISDSQNQLH